MLLSVNTFVSLDMVMQGPGSPDEDERHGFDRGGWLVPHTSDESNAVVDGWYRQADAILLGRTTFEMMREYWSEVTNPDDLVATALNNWQKYVVSTTMTDEEAAWGPTTVLRGDPIDAVRTLKQERGRELQVHGSWQLARTLHDAGLVDIYRLLIAPVYVGDGKRLFADGGVPATFSASPDESIILPNGVVSLVLRPRRTGEVEVGAYHVAEGVRGESV
ncbi:dihydrofolate reductase family protein [Lysobacter korlensis]|uniref:Dihydrofolate reductase family protein n=1 Tax=Lysobacter korlensis TaxID=553636 RepID=A0ABV6RW69_9GAMM